MKKGIWPLRGLFALLCVAFVSSQAAAQFPFKNKEEFPFLARVEEEDVNIRAGQNLNFEKVGSLKKNEKVVVVDKSYSWYKIKLPVYADSFASANFIKILEDGIAQVTADHVNIRARTDIASSVLGQLDKGDLIRVLGESEGWYKIEPSDRSYGWVLAEYLTFQSQDVPPPRIVQLSAKQNEQEAQRVIQEMKQRALKEAVAKAKEIAKEKADRISETGIIQDLGKEAISRDIRHKLVADGKTVCFLQGYRRIIDGFLNNKVAIEGKIQSDIKAKYPVILVTKINLIL